MTRALCPSRVRGRFAAGLLLTCAIALALLAVASLMAGARPL